MASTLPLGMFDTIGDAGDHFGAVTTISTDVPRPSSYD